MQATELVLRITNSRNMELTVHLEPWGQQHKLTAGASLKIEAKGPDRDDILELEYGDESITVYGWPGSVVEISPIE